MVLVEFDRGEFVLACAVLRVKSILEKFGSHRDIRETVGKLEPRLEAVTLIVLQPLIALQRAFGQLCFLGLLRGHLLLRRHTCSLPHRGFGEGRRLHYIRRGLPDSVGAKRSSTLGLCLLLLLLLLAGETGIHIV